jgi:hypothetical protein
LSNLLSNPIRFEERFGNWLERCAPRILIVTDSLNFQGSNNANFDLTEFVAILRRSELQGLRPRVTTAVFNPASDAPARYDGNACHIENFKFADPEQGLSTSHYDVVFLLANNRQGQAPLTDEQGALAAVTAFMQAGGGVFATGDHEDLGAGMCLQVPRVRAMRLWGHGTPSASGADRLTTILPGRGDQCGSNDRYELSDQSDRFPQRLFVNFRTESGAATFSPFDGLAHPVLQLPGRAIEVFPDHPNEGECVLPSDLSTTLPGGQAEWPRDGHGVPVAPEMVALSMSHGNGILAANPPGPKLPVIPRSFIAIAAYDGHRAQVGRVVTDASYHHFVDANIKPGTAQIAGRDLSDISQYYVNLASWLMPKCARQRRCHAALLRELARDPLAHEFPAGQHRQREPARTEELGVLVEEALLTRWSRAEVDALMHDALESAIGAAATQRLDALRDGFARRLTRGAALAALGALALGTERRFAAAAPEREGSAEAALAETDRACGAAVKRYLAGARAELTGLDDAIGSIVA